ncbi:mobilization protein [Kingella kingae]|uniref:mobilization protein n=1 Tax=Kingella kingae TaxID=504 RepID=UPI0025504F95|nr:mobilization protein [Kingella kingae]MDK4587443.1 mobilization protein [Kingella kingae]MDK4605350.1 mobilization protein [Kingella kingae]MDK4615603.1 mobilization protein [Kingella kingae]MDK4619602.1 mobilization protein [Kingella kingae]MDK4631604.1 mobilization protein [Kingella kingae]
MANIDNKISQVEAKLKQLRERKKLAENREKKKLKEQERKDDTRKKILLGAMYLQKMRSDEIAHEKILMSLDKFLKENRDRKLFGLPELPND